MNKGVVIGAGLGVLVLAFLAGIWFASSPSTSTSFSADTPGVQAVPHSRAPEALIAPPSPASVAPLQKAPWNSPVPSESGGSADSAASAESAESAGSATGHSEPMGRDERRKVRAAAQAKMAEFQAKGAGVTLEDTQKLMDDVQALGQGQFDARYFATMRKIIEYSARMQVLNKELGQLTAQKTPQADARKMAVLAEIRDLGDRINNGAQAMQSYSREALSGKQP